MLPNVRALSRAQFDLTVWISNLGIRDAHGLATYIKKELPIVGSVGFVLGQVHPNKSVMRSILRKS